MNQFGKPQFNTTQVELRKLGSQDVWHYTGNDLGEYNEFANDVLSSGGCFFDTATKKPYGHHVAKMDSYMAELVLAFEHLRGDGKTELHYSDEFPVLDESQARGFSTNYNYLVHFGLLKKSQEGAEVYYSLTAKGIQFANGLCKCDESLVNSGTAVINRFGEKHISFYLSNWDTIEHMWWLS